VLNVTKQTQCSFSAHLFFWQITVTLLLSSFEGRMRKNQDKWNLNPYIIVWF